MLKDTLFKTLCLIRNMQYCHCNQQCKFNTVGQGRIIDLLRQKGSLRTIEIANYLNMNVSSANEFISKLIKQGYVKRLTDPNDKRIKKVALTKLGKNLQMNNLLSDHIFDNLSEKQLSDLQNDLTIINNNLEKLLNNNKRKR